VSALKRPKNPVGFSASDSLTRADVGLPERHGDRVLRTDLGHLPLFAANRGSDADARVACVASEPARLSMGHNDSNTPQKITCGDSDLQKLPEIAVWGKGSRADFPAISDLNPNPRHAPPPKRTPRGKILSFSESSRRCLQRKLSTVNRHAPAFTMCLSCPGVWSPERNEFAKGYFLMLLKRVTASRDFRIRDVGFFWKQELQSREAVHFHLILWGVTSETRSFVHVWIAKAWNDLVCGDSDFDGKASHLAVHLHASNFEEVRNMAGYFSKYIGKDDKAVLLGNPIPGRWWGAVNSDCIPWAEKSVLTNLPRRFRVVCHRLARKLRQKRANAAKHAAIQRKIGLVHPSGPNKGKPFFSEFFLQCSPRRKIMREEIEEFAKTRLGPYKFPGALKTGAIVLVGEFAPAVAKQILTFAESDLRSYSSSNPF